MTLQDWIDELNAALEIDVAVDTRLVLDLARVIAHTVDRPATPISTFLLGYAAAKVNGDPEEVALLASRAEALAQEWEQRRAEPDAR